MERRPREDTVACLTGPPASVIEAEAALPAAPGLYGWWQTKGSLPEVEGPPHPSDAGLSLLYIGIAANLHNRVVKNHIQGRTGQSTLRRTLASLLHVKEGYTSRWTATRVVLVPDDEARLTEWMRRHLCLTWGEVDEPKAVEAEIISLLRPPLNLDHNRHHPGATRLANLRSTWRGSAGPRPT